MYFVTRGRINKASAASPEILFPSSRRPPTPVALLAHPRSARTLVKRRRKGIYFSGSAHVFQADAEIKFNVSIVENVLISFSIFAFIFIFSYITSKYWCRRTLIVLDGHLGAKSLVITIHAHGVSADWGGPRILNRGWEWGVGLGPNGGGKGQCPLLWH